MEEAEAKKKKKADQDLKIDLMESEIGKGKFTR